MAKGRGPTAPTEARSISVRAHASFAEIEPLWRTIPSFAGHPALDARWIGALEAAGCATSERGWIPNHLSIHDGAELLAVAPAYVKVHSEGEFVFDHGLARAASRFGVRYYPKLLVAVPFTPANGPRIGCALGRTVDEIAPIVAAALSAVVEQHELSSAHVNFLPAGESLALSDAGFIPRLGVQFHWENQGYRDFDGFLSTLPSKRRTQIRREKRAAREQGLELETWTGEKLTPALADALYALYLTTVDKFMWGRRYLNRAFFESVLGTMKDAIEVVVALDSSKKIVACAFNLRGDRALYGRYWGTHVELPFLHFNVCYYHAIERCIEERLDLFEPGAGGEHKEVRGFLPTLTHSAHIIRDEAFSMAVRASFDREREVLEREIASARTNR
ncbi:MAG: GNAT family N-acetyltransferase [Polyangiaceae bacterium]